MSLSDLDIEKTMEIDLVTYLVPLKYTFAYGNAQSTGIISLTIQMHFNLCFNNSKAWHYPFVNDTTYSKTAE
jgi:hypothetical protein